jgi:hypothetical protein
MHLADVENIARTASTFRDQFNPEDGCIKYVRSVGNLPHIHMVNNPRIDSTSVNIHGEILKSVALPTFVLLTSRSRLLLSVTFRKQENSPVTLVVHFIL